jgi:Kef-type K+ transport system membrane component KefB
MSDNVRFLLQLAVIVGAARLMGAIFRRFGQPQVCGEMAAGIALGPTLFGWAAPAAYRFLFPPESLGGLNALSQAGLTIFIFLAGVRVDFAELRRQSGLTAVTSSFSVLLPFAAGVALALFLYPRYGAGGALPFSLFIGTAIAATAFPVLVRILLERNMLETPIGHVAIACAAIDDIFAWILLAAIVGLTRQGASAHPVWVTCAGLACYGAVIFLAARILEGATRRMKPYAAVPFFLTLSFLGGAAGEWIGIHALAGAFLAGLATPRRFRYILIDRLEPLVLLLPIPIFFALTGIRTNLNLGIGAGYLDLALILFVAVAAKWGGTALIAHLKGLNWRDANQLGLLVNTRGLVELVVLSVGLDSRILSPALFSMMVAMALITTCMTTPLLDRFVAGSKLTSRTYPT